MRLPNGYGCISKLSRSKTSTVYSKDNCSDTEIQAHKSIKLYGYFATKKEALQALAEYNKKGYDIDRRKITFAQLYR